MDRFSRFLSSYVFQRSVRKHLQHRMISRLSQQACSLCIMSMWCQESELDMVHTAHQLSTHSQQSKREDEANLLHTLLSCNYNREAFVEIATLFLYRT